MERHKLLQLRAEHKLTQYQLALALDISTVYVRKLEKGITTPGETIKLFGEPIKKNISDRGERYVYGYLGDTLNVTFDSSHTVSSFLYRPAIFEPVEGNTDYQNKKINYTLNLSPVEVIFFGNLIKK